MTCDRVETDATARGGVVLCLGRCVCRTWRSEVSWRTVCARLAVEACLYVPAPMWSCPTTDWRALFFEHLLPARGKWAPLAASSGAALLRGADRVKPARGTKWSGVRPVLHTRGWP